MKSLKIGELEAKIPLIQGGMGVGISLSGLAGAVALEGGIAHFGQQEFPEAVGRLLGIEHERILALSDTAA